MSKIIRKLSVCLAMALIFAGLVAATPGLAQMHQGGQGMQMAPGQQMTPEQMQQMNQGQMQMNQGQMAPGQQMTPEQMQQMGHTNQGQPAPAPQGQQ